MAHLNSNLNASLTIFFPCFNEEDSIEALTLKALKVAKSISSDPEIIIVNDGSTDKTARIADSLAQANPEIKVVHHTVNQGYGAALQSGFKAASKEYVFYTDGDAQFDVEELPRLIALIPDCDIVSGFRLNRQEGMIRKLNAFCWGCLVCMVFRMRIRDIDCAFKLYRREIFDDIRMKSKGALIDAEILARALKKGYRIKQTGVTHYPRMAGSSTGASPIVILRAFKELFKLAGDIMKQPK